MCSWSLVCVFSRAQGLEEVVGFQVAVVAVDLVEAEAAEAGLVAEEALEIVSCTVS